MSSLSLSQLFTQVSVKNTQIQKVEMLKKEGDLYGLFACSLPDFKTDLEIRGLFQEAIATCLNPYIFQSEGAKGKKYTLLKLTGIDNRPLMRAQEMALLTLERQLSQRPFEYQFASSPQRIVKSAPFSITKEAALTLCQVISDRPDIDSLIFGYHSFGNLSEDLSEDEEDVCLSCQKEEIQAEPISQNTSFNSDTTDEDLGMRTMPCIESSDIAFLRQKANSYVDEKESELIFKKSVEQKEEELFTDEIAEILATHLPKERFILLKMMGHFGNKGSDAFVQNLQNVVSLKPLDPNDFFITGFQASPINLQKQSHMMDSFFQKRSRALKEEQKE